MKKNRLDQLISAAFGDEGIELGRLTDEEQRQFDALQSVSDGLKGLRDVPECQLSNERLRNAILNGAVKQRSFPGWGIATATVVCSALAVLVLQSRFNRAPEQQQPVAQNTEQTAPAVKADDAGSAKTTETKVAVQGSPIVDNTAPVKRVATRTTPHADPVAAESPIPEYMVLAGRDPNAVDLAPVSFSGDVHISIPSDVGTKPVEADRSGVVVVDADQTNSNGAYEATEVTSYGNVVFGG